MLHKNQPPFGILVQPAVQRGGFWLGAAKGYAQILLFDGALADQFGEIRFGFRIFCHHHKAAGAGVKPVAKARRAFA